MKKLFLIPLVLALGIFATVKAGGDRLIELPKQTVSFTKTSVSGDELGSGFRNPQVSPAVSSGTSTLGSSVSIGSTTINSSVTSTFGAGISIGQFVQISPTVTSTIIGPIITKGVFAPSSTAPFNIGYQPDNISSGTVRNLTLYGQNATNTHGGTIDLVLGTYGQGEFYSSFFRLLCSGGSYECLNIGPMTEQYTIINGGNGAGANSGLQFGYQQGPTSSASLIVTTDKTSENYWHVKGAKGTAGPVLEASSTTNTRFNPRIDIKSAGSTSTLAVQFNGVTSTVFATDTLFVKTFLGLATGTNGGIITPPSALSGGLCVKFTFNPTAATPVTTSTISCPAYVQGAF